MQDGVLRLTSFLLNIQTSVFTEVLGAIVFFLTKAAISKKWFKQLRYRFIQVAESQTAQLLSFR